METKLRKLKTDPFGQMIWIVMVCVIHLLLFRTKVNNNVALNERIIFLVTAVAVTMPIHELIHYAFMKIFSGGNAEIEFAKDPMGLPGLRAVLYGEAVNIQKITRLQKSIIFAAPLLLITGTIDIVMIFSRNIELPLFIIAICNCAGCYYDVTDCLITVFDREDSGS